MGERRYLRPSTADALFNGALRGLARLGISVYGTRLLAVRGRKSGVWRVAVVNLLDHEGARYLVAPRGETEWVRNLRAAGGGELRLGRSCEPFRASEVGDSTKPTILRAYLRRWGFEVAKFFPGVSAEGSDADLARVSSDYPVFRITAEK